MGNKEKAETLGMPHGTASGRLKKMLLFRQLKKHSENVCVRCNKEIEKVEELSVEHIKPWEGISAELFWDLDNVAFSHMFCNRPHNHDGGAETQRFKGPEGTAWCIACRKFESIECFWKDSRNWNGLQQYCKNTKHSGRRMKGKRYLAACGEKANAEGLNPSAHNELVGANPTERTNLRD